MLCLALKPGEYITIGDNVILQYDETSGDRCRIMIDAPREVGVVRGEVLERDGKRRPDCIIERKHDARGSIPWNKSKAASLAAIQRQLEKMSSDDRIRKLRRQLTDLFPADAAQ